MKEVDYIIVGLGLAGIAFAVAAFVISYLVLKTNLVIAFIAIAVTMIGFLPVIMRLSRNIWINFFMSYDAEKNELGKSSV